ncbi:phosphatases II [Cubamyces sp. BRFM 1775]|nr:phosphatases II [Cubamyces sp. BRFM 1775]
MSDFIRRLVSGNKARYKDEALDLELDLAYITDKVIVMGYPATGIEGLYRNRREDAKKFLDHHHGKNYWVFNFCPVRENAYPDSVFEGRVSRYPFPDHHAPPLAILPLVAREIRLWLDGAPERVAVLHCKAGKGRSGTMACAYLLSLDVAPSAPRLVDRSLAEKERAKSRAEQVMNAMPEDEAADVASADGHQAGDDPIKHEITDGDDKTADHTERPGDDINLKQEEKTAPARKDTGNSLSHVLELHTAQRMKRPSSPSKKLKQGVSIPSQRRWLYYWSLVLAHQAPQDFWSTSPEVLARPSPKVKLTQIKVRMRELSGLKTNLVRAVNTLVDTAGLSKKMAATKSSSQVWASLARYDDEFVETLEEWERHTRDESGNMGVRRRRADQIEGQTFADLVRKGKFDSKKMVRSFARMGTLRDEDIQKEESEADGRTETLLLRPLTGDKWQRIREKIEAEGKLPSEGADTVESEEASIYSATQTLRSDGGVLLDAHCELRVKLYLGQVFMGWFWFIPTFHLPHPRGSGEQSATLVLTRKEIDFPVGIGSHIIDVSVSMEWCSEAADVINPPERLGSAESAEGQGEPSGVAASLQAAAGGEVKGMMAVNQAAND